MIIELDTGNLWQIAFSVVSFIWLLLYILAKMTINGIHKKIETCQERLMSRIDSIESEHNKTRGIAIRAHTRIDDVLGYAFKKHVFEGKELFNGDTAHDESSN